MDDEKQMDWVQKIPIAELVPFKDHPFKVVEDESMLRTTESISMFGVLTPLIARPMEDGKFEIISGTVPIFVPFTCTFTYGRCSPVFSSNTCPTRWASNSSCAHIGTAHSSAKTNTSIIFFIPVFFEKPRKGTAFF